LAAVQDAGALSIQELSDLTGASLSTIRRDLNELSRFGYVERSHGGANLVTAPSTTFEPGHEVGGSAARRQKAAIGRFAAGFVDESQSILLDSGTTVLEVARSLVQR